MENFLLLCMGEGVEMCITDCYECCKRKGKIPLKKKKKQLMTNGCYPQSEMTGNTRWANSRHSMCRNPKS